MSIMIIVIIIYFCSLKKKNLWFWILSNSWFTLEFVWELGHLACRGHNFMLMRHEQHSDESLKNIKHTAKEIVATQLNEKVWLVQTRHSGAGDRQTIWFLQWDLVSLKNFYASVHSKIMFLFYFNFAYAHRSELKAVSTFTDMSGMCEGGNILVDSSVFCGFQWK